MLFPSIWIWRFPSEQISRCRSRLVMCQCQIPAHVWSTLDTRSFPQPRFSLFFFLPPIPFSFSSAVFSSVVRLPPLHGPRLMFHFQTTVASPCFISVLSLSLSSMYWETATQQREAKTQCPRWHIRGGGIWEAEASVALKWERTSLIFNLKLPCSHLWPALNSLSQAIHCLFSHKNKCVYTTSCINTHTHTHTQKQKQYGEIMVK